MWSSVIGCLVMLILSWLAVPLTADRQPPGKVPRIGLLIPGSSSGFSSRIEVFRQGLPEHGWMEGQNVPIEYRSAEGRAERFVDLAAKLVRLPVDVLVTWAWLSSVFAARMRPLCRARSKPWMSVWIPALLITPLIAWPSVAPWPVWPASSRLASQPRASGGAQR
jgi:hypothetical protein